jgi:hypothetical protein
VPPDIPDAKPVLEPTIATPVDPELHVPPGVPSLSDVVLPWHTAGNPVTGDTAGFTVTTAALVQPAGDV